jgi:hypothetical protein
VNCWTSEENEAGRDFTAFENQQSQLVKIFAWQSRTGRTMAARFQKSDIEISDHSNCRCSLFALFDEVCVIETDVLFGRLEMMWCQGHRIGRHTCFHLRLHQAINNSRRDEIVPLYATINNQRGADDCVVFPRRAQLFRQKWHFKCPWNIEGCDVYSTASVSHTFFKADQSLIDDFRMPAGLNEGDV